MQSPERDEYYECGARQARLFEMHLHITKHKKSVRKRARQTYAGLTGRDVTKQISVVWRYRRSEGIRPAL
jgi:hypothetical protein